jgi:AcrR family transcriptional regulator
MPKTKPGPGAEPAEHSTRERIVEAAVELMAEIGIDRVRTRKIAERAGVNPALVHYHFRSIEALVMEAAEHALLQELDPAIDALSSGATIDDGINALLEWIEDGGQRMPGSRILAEAMVKATKDPAYRRWTRKTSQRFRGLILDRLTAAQNSSEIDPALDLRAAAILLAAAFDGLLFHRLVDPKLDVAQTARPISLMLGTSRHSRSPGPTCQGSEARPTARTLRQAKPR